MHIKTELGVTWVGGGATEKPRSEAIDRASDMPPMRRRGFFPTQEVSLPIDILGAPKDQIQTNCRFWHSLAPLSLSATRNRQKPLNYFRKQQLPYSPVAPPGPAGKEEDAMKLFGPIQKTGFLYCGPSPPNASPYSIQVKN